MLKEFIKKHYLILALFVLALFLRTYNLSEIPVGLHGDEASIGYNAYSLLQTAHDQDGNFLPISIDQFGDFRPAGYHYLAVPFVLVLGLNEFAVRLPAALFASLTVIVLYFFLIELFVKKRIAVLGSFLLTFLPWDVNISRASSEAVIATFFVLLGLLLIAKFAKSKKGSVYLLAIGTTALLVSFFFYHAHRFFVPAFLPFFLGFLILSLRPARKRNIMLGVSYVVVLVGMVFFLTFGMGTGRVNSVSIFNIPGGTTQLKQAMDEEGNLHPLINRFYNNKAFFYGRFFGEFYSQHVSPDFLFVNNGYPIRYRMAFTGNLYLAMLPFLVFGLITLTYEGIKNKKYINLVPVVWFVLAPVPAALTWEDLPNVIRASLLIIPLVAISSFGFFEFLEMFKNKKIKTGIVVICGLILAHNILYFAHNYYWRSKIHEPWHRSGAEKELLFQVSHLSNQNDKIIMTTERNNNLIFYLFYNKFDPKKFHDLGSPREHDGLNFLNIKYVSNPCPISGDPEEVVDRIENTLFVTKEDCSLPRNAEVVQEVRFTDGVPAFKIVRVN